MESLGLAITLVALVSGDTKQGNEFPYIVSIHRDSDLRSFLCAGSLIASKWVLTSAHCLTKIATRIRYSSAWSLQNYNYSAILQRIRHKNTRSCRWALGDKNSLTPKVNNIGLALVECVSSINYARLSAIDYFALLGYEVRFMEFNYNLMLRANIYQSNKRRMDHIGRVRGKSVSFGSVKRPKNIGKLGNLDVNHSTPMGVGYRVGTGVVQVCQDKSFPGPTMCVAQRCIGSVGHGDTESVLPDYGAPLTHDGSIVGVSTDVKDSYSTYTPVSPYLDWINTVIAGNR
uniref:Peptidase S1 domain-containing protein n=1 Tax=Heliothis virescens TaxID=7102 RepID=A0A2A4JZS5_HELVI